MNRILAGSLIWLVALAAVAQTPPRPQTSPLKLTITAAVSDQPSPLKQPAGSLVVLNGRLINATQPQTAPYPPSSSIMQSVLYRWTTIPELKSIDINAYIDPDTKQPATKVDFANQTPGDYRFLLSASMLFVDTDKDGKVVGARHNLFVNQYVVTLTDGQPSPTPSPQPTPPAPPKPLPEGRFGLATMARDWCSKVNLSDADKRASAAKLSGVFKSVSAAIAAKTIPDPNVQLRWELQLIRAVTDNSAATLGPQQAAWADWSAAWQEKFWEFYAADGITTAEDMAVSFDEIAVGLDAL